MNDGYQGKFKAYSILVRNQAKLAWEQVFLHKDDFWNCFETHGTTNQSIGCGSYNNGGNYYYVLKKDRAAFCHDVDAQYNLNCAWIRESEITYSDPSAGGSNCQKTGIGCPINGQMYFPELDPAFEIADPGAAIRQALSSFTDLSHWLSDSAISSQLGILGAPEDEIIDGVSTTVFTVQAAVQAMRQVADIGEDAGEEQKKQAIMAFVFAFLLVIPGIGEIAGSFEVLAQVANIGSLALSITF